MSLPDDAIAVGGGDGSLEAAAEALSKLDRTVDSEEEGEEEASVETEAAPETEGDEEPQSDEGEKSEDEAEDPDGDDEQPQQFKVKVDGQELTVTLDELQKGYSREADYTRKTQALAEERKALDAAKQSAIEEARKGIDAEREQYKAVLGVWEKQINDALGSEEELAALRNTDPQAYAVRVADRMALQQRLASIQSEQQRVKSQEQSEQEARVRQHAQEEGAKLMAAIPDWKDPAKRDEGIKRLFDYAVNVRGFKPAEFAQVTDHRILLALNDAAALHALKSKPPVAVKKQAAPSPQATQPQPAPIKPIQPSAVAQQPARKTQYSKAMARLAQTGSVNDAAAALAALNGARKSG